MVHFHDTYSKNIVSLEIVKQTGSSSKWAKKYLQPKLVNFFLFVSSLPLKQN